MDFRRVITEICGCLDETSVRYALIGGFAMALRGVQRTTIDLDFLLLLDDLDRADDILRSRGYTRTFHSENVSHYRADQEDLGRIDILHAFRGPSLGMLDRATRLETGENISVPVLQVEDIIGLKVQASVNDPERESRDWLDIQDLLQASSRQGVAIDWELIGDYLQIFELDPRLDTMKNWYGKTD